MAGVAALGRLWAAALGGGIVGTHPHTRISPSVYVSKLLLETARGGRLLYALFIERFCTQQQHWAFGAEVIWPTKCKVIVTWASRKNSPIFHCFERLYTGSERCFVSLKGLLGSWRNAFSFHPSHLETNDSEFYAPNSWLLHLRLGMHIGDHRLWCLAYMWLYVYSCVWPVERSHCLKITVSL